MKRRGDILILFFLSFFAAVPKFIFAYDVDTHEALTNTALKEIKNSKESIKINFFDGLKLKKGSKDEDKPPRYINHFFDPISGKGWLGKTFFGLIPLPSIKWAFNSKAQSLPVYRGDFSWPPKEGVNKYEALGHLLHLLQDATVPEHTRLDTHIPLTGSGFESPYETFIKTFKMQSALNKRGIEASSLNSLFEYLAQYSNRYFFSEDTIESPQYQNPKIVRFKDEEIKSGIKVRYGMGKDENGSEFHLAVQLPPGKNNWRNLLSKTRYTVNDPLVMSDYAKLLIPKAIASGALAIKIALNEPRVLGISTTAPWTPPETENKNFPGKSEESAEGKDAKKPRKAFSGAKKSKKLVRKNMKEIKKETQQNDYKENIMAKIPEPSALTADLNQTQSPAPVQEPKIAEIPKIEVIPSQIMNPILANPPAQENTAPVPAPTPSPAPPTVSENPPVQPPAEIIPPPSQYLAVNEIAWAGTSSSTADEWIELYNPTPEEINLKGWVFEAEDGSPKISLNGSVKPYQYFLLERTDDSAVPGIQANQIYTGNLNNDGENLILKDNFGRIIDQLNFSSGWPAGDNATRKTMQRINPKESGSNAKNWSSSPNPQGSPKSANPNSILSNYTAPKTVWPKTTFNQIAVNIKNSSTTAQYNQIIYKSLESSTTPCLIQEEELPTLLKTATTTESMIYITNLKEETYYCLGLRYWTDSGPSLISTTTVNTLLNPLSPNIKKIGGKLFGGHIWSPNFNPYIITSALQIMPESILVIEPGVVIKFSEGKQILVDGELTAVGTDDNPIVFTSIYDDEFAGDTNGDLASTTPKAGDWERIQMGGTFCSISCGLLRGPVTLNRTIIRYGGSPTSKAMLYNSESKITIINSDIGYSYGIGLLNLGSVASSSTTTVKFNFFHHNQTAIKNIAGSKTDIEGNKFENNLIDTFP